LQVVPNIRACSRGGSASSSALKGRIDSAS
jgi:hypothetical protein